MTERLHFWQRFARLNAPLLVSFLRGVADEIEALEPGPPTVGFPVVFNLEGGLSVGAITVKDNSGPLGATVTFLDARGNATSPDSPPVWSSSDETIATAAAADDGLSASVTIVGGIGAAVIAVDTTDTDGTIVHSEGTITVQPSEAVVGDVEFAAAP